MKSTIRFVFVCLASALLNGCITQMAHIRGTLPTIEASQAKNIIRAGAAKVDITPPPGIPMGGHSKIGQVARGHWLRLKARSLYIESPDGSKLALVASDLWSMPAGLANRVAVIVGHHAPKSCKLSREQMIFAATHTHQSPGNFSTSQLYNFAGSKKSGFDQSLFNFLANKLATVVQRSCEAAEAAELNFRSSQVLGLARNRSIDAFLRNPEADEILQEGDHILIGKLPRAYTQNNSAFRAIDPRLQTLWITAENGPPHVIGVAAFTAVHPTALTHESEMYSSDLFGAASIITEQKLQAISGARAPIVAIFNGAEGDVSPAWINQDRQDVLTLGEILSEAIIKTESDNSDNTEVSGDIQVRFAIKQIAGQHIGKDKTSEHQKGQPSAFAGAEDGRTGFFVNYVLGCQEGWDISITKPSSWLKPVCWYMAYPIGSFIASSHPAPKKVPLGVYKFGPIVFATLPGEFTTTMGRRIRNQLVIKLKIKKDNIILIGLANEYVSYFTTPEEYKANHYEGGMTLYGEASGSLVSNRLNELAAALGKDGQSENVTDNSEKEFYYEVGEAKTFTPEGLNEVGENNLRNNIIESMYEKRGVWPEIHSYCWKGFAPTIAEAKKRNWNTTPFVEIESQEQPDNKWQPLIIDSFPENDEGKNIIVELSKWEGSESEWCTFWLPPSELKATNPLRFKVTGHDKTLYASKSFWLDSNFKGANEFN